MARPHPRKHPSKPNPLTLTKETIPMTPRKHSSKSNPLTLTKETIPMTPKKPITIPVHSTKTPTSTPKGVPIVPTSIPIVTTPSAPTTSSSSVVLSTTPPVVSLPPIPAGFTPVNLVDYRGYHPRVGQVAALPDAVAELSSSSTYAATFGPAAPAEGTFVTCLEDAASWSSLHGAIEAFLVYVKSQEAVAWKAALTQIDQAKAVYDVTIARNPSVPTQFPALTRLLEVTNAIGRKSAASRQRKKATDAKKAAAAANATAATAAPATGATTAPLVAPATNAPTGGTGGTTAH
jgi:hypothetical protein